MNHKKRTFAKARRNKSIVQNSRAPIFWTLLSVPPGSPDHRPGHLLADAALLPVAESHELELRGHPLQTSARAIRILSTLGPLSVVDDNQKVVGALSVVGATKITKFIKFAQKTYITSVRGILKNLTFSDEFFFFR